MVGLAPQINDLRFRNIFKVSLGTVPCTEIGFYNSLNAWSSMLH